MKQTPSISLSEPFPLLDPGQYVAVCTGATFAWARQWKKWIARLVLEPENYQGRPYQGRLCAFLGLGKNPERPYAGRQSRFRRLLVEVNGAQPTAAVVGMEMFVGVRYEIEVVTVTEDRDGNLRPPEHWYSIVREIHSCKAGSNSKPTRQPFNAGPLNTQTQGTQGTLTTDQHSNTGNTPVADKRDNAVTNVSPKNGVGFDKLANELLSKIGIPGTPLLRSTIASAIRMAFEKGNASGKYEPPLTPQEVADWLEQRTGEFKQNNTGSTMRSLLTFFSDGLYNDHATVAGCSLQELRMHREAAVGSRR